MQNAPRMVAATLLVLDVVDAKEVDIVAVNVKNKIGQNTSPFVSSGMLFRHMVQDILKVV